MAELAEITKENFQASVGDGDGLALVYFSAPWCKPGREMEETVLSAAEEIGDRLVYGRVNTDEQPEIARKLGVRTIPTVKFLRRGAPVGEIRGNVSKLDLEKRVSEVFGQHGDVPAE